MSFSQMFESALKMFADSKGSSCITFQDYALQEALLSLGVVYYYGCGQKMKQRIESAAYHAMKLSVIFIKIHGFFPELLFK
jgi:hypothetical protein